MAPRTWTVFLVLVVVLLSGCGGVPGASTTGPNTTTSHLQTQAPPSYQAAVDEHLETLRAIGNFRYDRRIRFRAENVGWHTTLNVSAAVDLTANRHWFAGDVGLQQTDGAYTGGATYQTGDAVYTRTVLGNGSVVYERRPNPGFNPQNYTMQWLDSLENFTATFPFSRNGTATFDGEVMTRYTARSENSLGRCKFIGSSGGKTIVEMQATVLIDDQGVIRKYECVVTRESVTGDRSTTHVTVTLTEVADVMIRPPDRMVENTSS